MSWRAGSVAGVPTTDWSRYDVPDLWAMVAVEDDERCWRQVIAWQTTHGVLDEARQTLEAHRAALTRVPGTPVPRRIDSLIRSVAEAAEAAAANANALQGVVRALAEARQTVQPIYESWLRYAQSESRFAVALSGAWGVQPLEVPENWREELNLRARTAMHRAEEQLLGYASRFTPTVRAPGAARMAGVGPG